jgi:hypothetical protein
MNKILCIILVYTPEKNKIRLYPFSLVQKFQLYQLGDEEDPFTLDLEALCFTALVKSLESTARMQSSLCRLKIPFKNKAFPWFITETLF